MAETNTALEKPAEKTSAITTPDEYRDAMKRWQANYNVLTPFSNISGLAQSHAIIASVVQLDLHASYGKESGAGDVYGGLPFLNRGKEKGADDEELAIAKNGLRKIAEGGAISTRTERTDDRRQMFYWEFKCVATYRGIDGSVVTREATVEWDLRDGSPRMKGWSPNQIEEGRKNGLRNCETRAVSAAIREFGIKQKYTRAELKRPFVICRVMFQPDMSDPDIKKLVTERALGGTTALYPAPALPAHSQVVDGEVQDESPRHVGRGSTQTPAPQETKPEDRPPTEYAVRIEKVVPKSGETNGRKWTRYLVIDSNGVEASTFDTKLADFAKKCIDERTWVELTTEPNGNYSNLIEITIAGQQPSLLPQKDAL
jgi:hypothetical protein